MKRLYQSFKIAFSMYSKIPMPYADWNAENMKYSMCFFPLVGAVIGLLTWLWSILAARLPLEHQLNTAVFILIPMLVTGGIHFDGFLDTQDALNSHQTKERKLEILKDPHTGAFAIISGILYFILAFGIWSEVTQTSVWILSIGFVVSRSFSGLSVVTFPMAKNSGLAATFSENAQKRRVKITMYGYLLACSIGMFCISWYLAVAALGAAILVFLYYHYMSNKEFGGITGDLCGYFLQVCELVMAIAVIVVDRMRMIG